MKDKCEKNPAGVCQYGFIADWADHDWERKVVYKQKYYCMWCLDTQVTTTRKGGRPPR